MSIGPAELETFLAIAELGSFSKAAELLSLSQPSVSNRIQRLEHAVRTRLFERTRRAVVLTAEGERLRARAEPIMLSLHAVVDEFCAGAEARSQLVVVAATPMLATVVLPPIINRFSKANPAIRVDLQDQVTTRLASDIRSGRVDFAVMARPAPAEGIAFESVTSDTFVVIGPHGHKALGDGGPVSFRTLSEHPFLVLGAHAAHIEAIAAEARRQGIDLSAVRTVKNVSTLLGLVAEGLGLTLLPSFVIRVGSMVDDTRFRIAPLDGTPPTRDYGIASMAGHEWSAAARAFAQSLRTELQATTAGIRRPAAAPGPSPRPATAPPPA